MRRLGTRSWLGPMKPLTSEVGRLRVRVRNRGQVLICCVIHYWASVHRSLLQPVDPVWAPCRHQDVSTVSTSRKALISFERLARGVGRRNVWSRGVSRSSSMPLCVQGSGSVTQRRRNRAIVPLCQVCWRHERRLGPLTHVLAS